MALPALHTRLPAALTKAASEFSINLRYAESYCREKNDEFRANETSSIKNSFTSPFTAETAAAVHSPSFIFVPNVAGHRLSPKLTFDQKATTLPHHPASESVHCRSTLH